MTINDPELAFDSLGLTSIYFSDKFEKFGDLDDVDDHYDSMTIMTNAWYVCHMLEGAQINIKIILASCLQWNWLKPTIKFKLP